MCEGAMSEKFVCKTVDENADGLDVYKELCRWEVGVLPRTPSWLAQGKLTEPSRTCRSRVTYWMSRRSVALYSKSRSKRRGA